MEKRVRCKFKVESVTRTASSKWDGEKNVPAELHTVKLGPVFGTSPENKALFAATPSGLIDVACVNPEAAAGFELGREYYVDFTPAG